MYITLFHMRAGTPQPEEQSQFLRNVPVVTFIHNKENKLLGLDRIMIKGQSPSDPLIQFAVISAPSWKFLDQR